MGFITANVFGERLALGSWVQPSTQESIFIIGDVELEDSTPFLMFFSLVLLQKTMGHASQFWKAFTAEEGFGDQVLKPHHLFVSENPPYESTQQTLQKTCQVLTRAPDLSHSFEDSIGAIAFEPFGFIE